MFFDDDFILGSGPRGLTGFGDLGLDGFGDFSRVGEVVITGRVPGALYVDDISIDQTPLEYLLPFVHTETSVTALETAFAPISPTADETLVEAVADEPAEQDEAPAAGILIAESRSTDDGVIVEFKADLPAAPVTFDDAPPAIDEPDQGPVNDFGFDFEITEYAADLPPAPGHQVELTAPTPVVVGLSVDVPPPPASVDTIRDHTLGGAFQSLSFLILDTPFVVGDSQLPPTVRPSLQDLMGPLFEDLFPNFTPRSSSWLLGRA